MSKVTEGQLKLYEMMLDRHNSKSQFTREDIMDVYNKYVCRKERKKYYESDKEPTPEQILHKAELWFERAVVILIKKGYIGLSFKKKNNTFLEV